MERGERKRGIAIARLISILITGLLSSFGVQANNNHEIVFRAAPTKGLYKGGEEIVVSVSIRNVSATPILVSRLQGNEFVDIKLVGPGNTEVPWKGTGKVDGKAYSREEFAILGHGESVRATRTISFKDGSGFIFDKPGSYSMTAEYSMGPPEYFAPFAGKATVPAGEFRAPRATFCVEHC